MRIRAFRTWKSSSGITHRIGGPAEEGDDGDKVWCLDGDQRMASFGDWSRTWGAYTPEVLSEGLGPDVPDQGLRDFPGYVE